MAAGPNEAEAETEICNMRKNYNYGRRKLFLPEYGRHIHEMIDTLMRIATARPGP